MGLTSSSCAASAFHNKAILPSCAADSSADHPSHHNDQLPALDDLFAPTDLHKHHIIFSPCTARSTFGIHSDSVDRAFWKPSAQKGSPPEASKFSKVAVESSDVSVTPAQISGELVDDSDHQSVLTTISPTKERSQRRPNYSFTNSQQLQSVKETSSLSSLPPPLSLKPLLSLRLPVERSATSDTRQLQTFTPIDVPIPLPPISTPRVPPEDLLPLKQAIIVDNAPLALQLVQQLIKHQPHSDLSEAVALEDVVWQDSDVESMLHLAVQHDARHVIRAFLDMMDSATVARILRVPNRQGDTVISQAAALRHYEMLSLLMHYLTRCYLESPHSPAASSKYSQVASAATEQSLPPLPPQDLSRDNFAESSQCEDEQNEDCMMSVDESFAKDDVRSRSSTLTTHSTLDQWPSCAHAKDDYEAENHDEDEEEEEFKAAEAPQSPLVHGIAVDDEQCPGSDEDYGHFLCDEEFASPAFVAEAAVHVSPPKLSLQLPSELEALPEHRHDQHRTGEEPVFSHRRVVPRGVRKAVGRVWKMVRGRPPRPSVASTV